MPIGYNSEKTSGRHYDLAEGYRNLFTRFTVFQILIILGKPQWQQSMVID